jgi:hypothetical protein
MPAYRTQPNVVRVHTVRVHTVRVHAHARPSDGRYVRVCARTPIGWPVKPLVFAMQIELSSAALPNTSRSESTSTYI